VINPSQDEVGEEALKCLPFLLASVKRLGKAGEFEALQRKGEQLGLSLWCLAGKPTPLPRVWRYFLYSSPFISRRFLISLFFAFRRVSSVFQENTLDDNIVAMLADSR
jgi:hypothetical protein